MPRPTRRLGGLVVGAAVLFTVGTSVQAGWLLLLAALLLGVAIAGIVLPDRMVRGLEIQRRAPAEAFQGDRVGVELVVGNVGRGMRLSLELEDTHLARTRMFVGSVAPGERVAVGTTRRAARRGVQESTEVQLRSAAPFGVAERRRTVSVAGRTVVYPAVVELDGIALIDAVPSLERAIHSYPRLGHGPDYLGIREYRPGDSMRHVHWPSTARTGTVMVREFEEETTRRLAIVLDTWVDAGEEDTPLDACCSVAASVALAAVGGGRGVRLVAAREGALVSLSRADPAAMLAWLAELRPFGGMPLAEVGAWLGPELRGIETVLLVLPTWTANGNGALEESIGALGSLVSSVTAVLVDAASFPADRRAPAMGAEGAASLARRLESKGVTVYRFGAGEDLATCLQRPLVSAR